MLVSTLTLAAGCSIPPNSNLLFLDTETVGYHGPIILIQYAIGYDGEVELYSPWSNTIKDTLDLIEMIMHHPGGVCVFNASFESFHLAQMYTTLLLLGAQVGYDKYLEDHITEYALLEPQARDGPCTRPQSVCDLMLWARKGPYQSVMARDDIRIRNVPVQLAWRLAQVLEDKIRLKDIYFEKKKDKLAAKWKVFDRTDTEDFKDVVLKFHAAGQLKAIAKDLFNLEDAVFFTEVAVAEKPVEYSYAPFALAVGDESDWKGAWPDVIRFHITHWGFNPLAREYAKKDVQYLQQMHPHPVFAAPAPGDDDSELAWLVGVSRWRGYAVDIPVLKSLRAECKERKGKFPRAPKQVFRYLAEALDEVELIALQDEHGKVSTKKVLLEELKKWDNHPVAQRAKDCLEARQASYDEDVYKKLIKAGRMHVDFVVIGARSSRMAGGSGIKSKGGSINPQGIKKQERVRLAFPLALPGMVLKGGDFEGFEVTLMDAVYADPKLREALLTGKKIHGLFGVHVYPDKTYEEICASSGSKEFDYYTRSKSAVFAMAYGGEGFTLKNRLGVELEIAEKAYQAFMLEYSEMGRKRKKYADMFQPMRQPGGPGTKVEWHTPADYIESIFGFRRYFTLENAICKALFDLANKPPKDWLQIKGIKVVRRADRGPQTIAGAVQSALYGAAFQIQAANMRAAGNHVIQSSGAQLTKMLQRRLWDVQPKGVAEWHVQPMNIHDEIMCPALERCSEEIDRIQREFVNEFKDRVPLLKIDWHNRLASWADK